MATSSDEENRQPFLTINETPVFFSEDWATGLGGGLWSTGLAIATYLSQHPDHALGNLKHKKQFSFLELGSGNGFLATCFMALQKQKDLFHPIVITDFADHLPLIQKTINENKHLLSSKVEDNRKPIVIEHAWGEFPPESDDDNNNQSQQHPLKNQKFDLIVGSDVAYRDHLHDPLIQSLLHFSHSDTSILLGVTMSDTRPIFFQKLIEAGFSYVRLANWLMDEKFRGTTFGIFVVQRKKA
jgi:predicted nicotinamide N-methyase